MKTNTAFLYTKVRRGFYRAGAYCIHQGRRWGVYEGPAFKGSFDTLNQAVEWARDNQPAPAHADGTDD